ncbi:hypothetical protein N865_02550 [Intrasporangium oryzae NRRL B-24470]|uniref:YCII-related domain-containing protein n=1 Tax=Intrasporangium oryzae NRRL B-24470 TaxID=1386089 RepID=W9G8R1_9MICO|nr:YciI family protein [Intrasporangium oryzae]EWT02561.1 hypothetical protein N865_02550 [Intrasporangium oryzae NRRL B-24470]
MKYMLLLLSPEDGIPASDTPEGQRLFQEWATALEGMQSAGVLIDSAPLTGASVATTVRVRDGELLITDGPAAEIREQVGGYTLIDCAHLDDALKWAATIPTAKVGSVEVRVVLDTGRSR